VLLPHTPTLTGSEDGLGAAARRIGCAAGALLSALLLLSVAPYHMGWIVGTLLCAVVILSAWRPGDGLLGLAGLGPVATLLAGWRAPDRGAHARVSGRRGGTAHRLAAGTSHSGAHRLAGRRPDRRRPGVGDRVVGAAAAGAAGTGRRGIAAGLAGTQVPRRGKRGHDRDPVRGRTLPVPRRRRRLRAASGGAGSPGADDGGGRDGRGSLQHSPSRDGRAAVRACQRNVPQPAGARTRQRAVHRSQRGGIVFRDGALLRARTRRAEAVRTRPVGD